MTEPITGLGAKWVDNVGITFSWTAAEDVTNASSYLVYYLDNSQTVPTWTFLTTLYPVPVKVPEQTKHVLTNPSTTYFLQWSQMVTWATTTPKPIIPSYMPTGQSTLFPLCVAIQIVHVDSTGSESDPTTDFVFSNSFQNQTLPSHLSNNFGFDVYGQALVNTQDSINEIMDSVSMLLGTGLGQRTMVPRYGIEDLPFHKIDVNLISAAIQNWEPRAKVNLSVIVNSDRTESVNVQLLNSAGV